MLLIASLAAATFVACGLAAASHVISERAMRGSLDVAPGDTVKVKSTQDWVDDGPVQRFSIAIGDKPFVLPAGVPRFGVGECALSPALKAALRKDPEAAGRFCGGVGKTIGHGALRDPGERLGFVGLPATALATTPVRYGGVAEDLSYANNEISTGNGVLLVVTCALLPTMALLFAMAIRFSVQRQERMVSALGLLRATRRQMVWVVVGEMFTVAVAGVVAGAVAWAAATKVMVNWNFGRARWFASDLQPTTLSFLVPVALLAFALGLGIVGSRRAIRAPLAVRRSARPAQSGRIRWWVPVALAAVLAAWGWMFALGAPADPEAIEGRQLMIVAIAIAQLCVSLPLVRLATVASASAVAGRSRSPWSLLAARASIWDSRAIARIFGFAAVAAQVVALSFLLTATMSDGPVKALERSKDRPVGSLVAVPGELSNNTAASAGFQVRFLNARPVNESRWNLDGGNVLVSSCANAARLFDFSPDKCAHETSLRFRFRGAPAPAASGGQLIIQKMLEDVGWRMPIPTTVITIDQVEVFMLTSPTYWLDESSALAKKFAEPGGTFSVFPFDRSASTGPTSEQAMRNGLADRFESANSPQTIAQEQYGLASNRATADAVIKAVASVTALLLVFVVVLGTGSNLEATETLFRRLRLLGSDKGQRLRLALWQVTLGAGPALIVSSLAVAAGAISLIRLYRGAAITSPLLQTLLATAVVLGLAFVAFAVSTALAVASGSETDPRLGD